MKVLKTILALAVVFCLACAAVVFTPLKNEALKLLYPLKYTAIVEQEAEKYDLDPVLVYAVIKTESGFDPDAYSRAGAKGLMQMTDETFAWMQEILGEEGMYAPEDLYDPEISVRYGCALLSRLLQYYGNRETALCAYNAGMGNVSSWLEDPDHSEDGETIFYIPFEETKNYVKKVARAESMYRELYEL